ncbi:hypothetical protein [Actinoplanes sp. NPDC051494]|uniref:hypothetical protein n=1 Tax=Actinoplanes sp. NPDC051494 TaxID=3363907 RepID=UPI0037A28777
MLLAKCAVGLLGTAIGLTPAVAPAAPRLAVSSVVTYLGYAPTRGGTGELRVVNAGGATARHVTVRLAMQLERGISGTLAGADVTCEQVRAGAVRALGDLPARSSVTLTVTWEVHPRPGPAWYDEAARGTVTATAGTATPATGTVVASGTTGSFPIAGPDAVVRPRSPRTLTVEPGRTVDLPITFRAEGQAPAEGVYVRVEVDALRLVRPRGSRCVGERGSLLCYLPVRLMPGRQADAWGRHNPFRVAAGRGAARVRPYDIVVNVSPGNGTHRHVGLGRDGRLLIRPTVPLTTSVNGNYHDTQDALIPLTVPAGAPLPITGTPAAAVATAGISSAAAGATLILAGRRRRPRRPRSRSPRRTPPGAAPTC